MASNKRKQDEKHLKTLREMVSLPINKQCFDCHQRGPTYVNMTIGSFVCTSCSGILRGLNPPHRVKSISMASFTPDEMEFLKSHGNELNRKVYLGLYDSRSWPEPDSRDEQRVRDYMVQKYENKRWYVAPTDAMKEDAKRSNEAALNSKPQAKPLRSMLGENAPRMVLGSNQAPASNQVTSSSSPIQPPPVKAPTSSSASHPPPITNTAAPATAAKSDGFDLLGELGGDPFSSNAPAAPVTNNAGGFADFSNFGNFNSTPAQPQQQAPLPQQQQQQLPHSSPAFPISNTPLVPLGCNSSAPTPASSNNTNSQPTQSATFVALNAGDRYAALADLDSAFSAPTTTSTAINWGGSEACMTSAGGNVNWGGSSAPVANPSSQASSTVNWSSNGGGGAFNWNSQSSGAVPPASSTPSSVGFGAPSTAANPFGTSQAPSFSTPGSTPNPFGAGVVSSPAAPGFGTAPFQQPAGQAGFGQFPVQNGGFGMTPVSAYGAGSPAQGVFATGQQQPHQQPFMMQQPVQGQQVAGMGSWGAVGAPSAGMPQLGGMQPTANPFMNAAMQQQHVPPPSGATNPFL